MNKHTQKYVNEKTVNMEAFSLEELTTIFFNNSQS